MKTERWFMSAQPESGTGSTKKRLTQDAVNLGKQISKHSKSTIIVANIGFIHEKSKETREKSTIFNNYCTFGPLFLPMRHLYLIIYIRGESIFLRAQWYFITPENGRKTLMAGKADRKIILSRASVNNRKKRCRNEKKHQNEENNSTHVCMYQK